MTNHRDAIQQRLTEVLRGYLTQQEAILVEPVPMADVFLGITNFYIGMLSATASGEPNPIQTIDDTLMAVRAAARKNLAKRT
jgi:hypothetical protein